MMEVTTIEPQRYIPMFGLSGLGFQLQGKSCLHLVRVMMFDGAD